VWLWITRRLTVSRTGAGRFVGCIDGPVTAKLGVLATQRKAFPPTLTAGRFQIQARMEPTFDILPVRAASRVSGKARIATCRDADFRQNVRFVKSRTRCLSSRRSKSRSRPQMAKAHSFAVTGPNCRAIRNPCVLRAGGLAAMQEVARRRRVGRR
jgi:hypothetical protein